MQGRTPVVGNFKVSSYGALFSYDEDKSVEEVFCLEFNVSVAATANCFESK